jgi:hypothetical protein
VPAGLTKPSASLSSLVEFLRGDTALVRASANAAAKSRTVADLMRELEAGSRKLQRVSASLANPVLGAYLVGCYAVTVAIR